MKRCPSKRARRQSGSRFTNPLKPIRYRPIQRMESWFAGLLPAGCLFRKSQEYSTPLLGATAAALAEQGDGRAMNTTYSNTLDRIAITMAVICGIHCLVTPILLVALPIITTTFWVDENFHLWMLLLVIPTTGLALWSGCTRHKDKWVIAAAALGLCLLVTALLTERIASSNPHALDDAGSPVALVQGGAESSSQPQMAGGGCCALHPAQSVSTEVDNVTSLEVSGIHWHAMINTLGGLFLVLGHTRNFVLCRKSDCSHEGGYC